MFNEIWIYFDIFYSIMLLVVTINSLVLGFGGDASLTRHEMRTLFSLLSLTICGKMLYFMKLIESISPLIYIIIRIFYDIKWFMITLVIILFAFSNSFQLIAMNQIEDDNLLESNPNFPEYNSLLGAFDHLTNLMLGDYKTDMYIG